MHRAAFRSEVELLAASHRAGRLRTSQAGSAAKAAWVKRQAQRNGRSFTVPDRHASVERLAAPPEASAAAAASAQHLSPLAELEGSYRRHGAAERSATLHSAKAEWFTRQAKQLQRQAASLSGAPTTKGPSAPPSPFNAPGEAWVRRSRGTSLLEKLVAERKQAEARAQEKARKDAEAESRSRSRSGYRVAERSTAPALAALARYKDRQEKAKLAAAEAAAAAFVQLQRQQPPSFRDALLRYVPGLGKQGPPPTQQQQPQQKGPLRFVPGAVAFWRTPEARSAGSRPGRRPLEEAAATAGTVL